jgi:hypothetical protein
LKRLKQLPGLADAGLKRLAATLPRPQVWSQFPAPDPCQDQGETMRIETVFAGAAAAWAMVADTDSHAGDSSEAAKMPRGGRAPDVRTSWSLIVS